MSALDIAAIVILILLAVIAIAVFAFLGSWGHLKVCALKHANSDKTGTPVQLAC